MTEVEDIIRDVAKREISPRFRNLSASDVAEKSPGDPVTVADRAAEVELTRLLTAFLPGSVVVGEESVSDDGSVLELLDGPDPVWIIDPIDGTRNFVAGSPHFATLVTLAKDGTSIASWTHAPELDVTATALKERGAFVNGEPVSVAAGPHPMTGLDVAVPQELWWTAREREQFGRLERSGACIDHYTSAGIEYLEVAAGRRTAMVLTWEYCWDHAAGVLLVDEAGGVTREGDMLPFKLFGAHALPFVTTTDQLTAERLQRTLRGLPPK